MALQTNGLSHIALRVSDLTRAKRFYVDTLGFALMMEADVVVTISVNGLPIALLGQPHPGGTADRFDPFRIGLDHLALAIADAGQLETLRQQLDTAGVAHNGIEVDAFTGASYISFSDPDGIAWELYALGQQRPA